MTAITQPLRPPPHRTRRNLTVGLVAGSLLLPIALLVRHAVDDDARPVESAVVRESSLDSDLGSGVSPGSSPVLVPPLRLVVNEASSIACASFADACVSAQTWIPVR